jgi:putative acetyltransferase
MENMQAKAKSAFVEDKDSHGKGIGEQLFAEAINQADNWLNISV